MSSQSDIFLKCEGDEFYKRGYESAFNIQKDRELLLDWCNPRKESISKILEIGAGNGMALANMANKLNSEAIGIEPSSKAVQDWQSRRLNIKGGEKTTLQVGLSNNLPFKDSIFDLVHFGFVLYLVDRKDIYRSISEADRVLKDGGLLSIMDFDPIAPYSNPYTHKEGIKSYKNDYSKIFLASGHYTLMYKHSYSLSGFNFHEDNNERISISLLYKQEDYVYAQKLS